MNEKKFFILWQPASNLPPTVKFSSYGDALAVAEEMAARHKKPFYVMEALACAEPVTVRTRFLG